MDFQISSKYIQQIYFENVKYYFFRRPLLYIYTDWYSNYRRQGNFNIKQFTQSVHMSEYKRVHALKGKRTLVMKILASRKRPWRCRFRFCNFTEECHRSPSSSKEPEMRARAGEQTRVHIAPPFCRTLTAYGVIKSSIYSSRTPPKTVPSHSWNARPSASLQLATSFLVIATRRSDGGEKRETRG